MPALPHASNRWLEIWVGPDPVADHLVALRPADGGYALVDPQNGWRPIHRFDSYDAAACWLYCEAFEPDIGRCALP